MASLKFKNYDDYTDELLDRGLFEDIDSEKVVKMYNDYTDKLFEDRLREMLGEKHDIELLVIGSPSSIPRSRLSIESDLNPNASVFIPRTHHHSVHRRQ